MKRMLALTLALLMSVSLLAGCSNIIKNTAPGTIAVGSPAESQREFMTRLTLPKRVLKLDAKIKELEAQVAELKKSAASN